MAEVYAGFLEGTRVLYNGSIEAYVGFPENPQRDRTPEWFRNNPEYVPLVFPGHESRPGLHHGAYFPSSCERVEPPPRTYHGFTEGERVRITTAGRNILGTVDGTVRHGQYGPGERGSSYVPIRLDDENAITGGSQGWMPRSITREGPPPPPPPQKCIPGAQSHEILRIYHWARDQNGCAGVIMRPAAEYDYEAAERHGVDVHPAAMIDSDWYIETATWLDDNASASTCCTIVGADGTNIATWEVQ